jgi:hypothetical protein
VAVVNRWWRSNKPDRAEIEHLAAAVRLPVSGTRYVISKRVYNQLVGTGHTGSRARTRTAAGFSPKSTERTKFLPSQQTRRIFRRPALGHWSLECLILTETFARQ